jgi:hypothetical protein
MAVENIFSKPLTDVRKWQKENRKRQKIRQRADEISKEDGGRTYFVQAGEGCQKGQTEKQNKERGTDR